MFYSHFRKDKSLYLVQVTFSEEMILTKTIPNISLWKELQSAVFFTEFGTLRWYAIQKNLFTVRWENFEKLEKKLWDVCRVKILACFLPQFYFEFAGLARALNRREIQNIDKEERGFYLTKVLNRVCTKDSENILLEILDWRQ